ncbi:MAG: hypothetical protein DME66_09170 [Verrucomicrobia bacterium]|nr:MAG: hypothetical protein DME66_09170 [Verrucomicrobiota bacterium]
MKNILLARRQFHHYEQNTEKKRANGHSETTLTNAHGFAIREIRVLRRRSTPHYCVSFVARSQIRLPWPQNEK